MRRFGIQKNEILIKVNGEPVKNRAHGIKVGKNMHRKGTRSFTLTFFSDGQTVDRVYRVPDKK